MCVRQPLWENISKSSVLLNPHFSTSCWRETSDIWAPQCLSFFSYCCGNDKSTLHWNRLILLHSPRCSPSWWGHQDSWSWKQLSHHIHRQEKEMLKCCCSAALLLFHSFGGPAAESHPHGLIIPPQPIQSRLSLKARPEEDLLLSFHYILRFLMV